METAIPEITEVQRLTIRPRDKLIVRCDCPIITHAVAATIEERVRVILKLSPDIPILVISSEMQLTVAGETE